MNVLSRGFLIMLLALAVGCTQTTTPPITTKTLVRPTRIERVSLLDAPTETKSKSCASKKLDCCGPPSKFSFVSTPRKTAPMKGIVHSGKFTATKFGSHSQKTVPTKVEHSPKAQPTKPIDNTVSTDFLKPAAPALPWVLEKQPQKKLPVPAFLEHPESVFPPIPVEPIQTPLERTQVVVLPRTLPEEAPRLADQNTPPKLPAAQPLPMKPLVRLPRVDLETPVELPPLAKFQPERAPLVDVTGEASREAVLAQPIPVRTNPEPFLRWALPDPYEFRSIRLSPPTEEK